MRVQVSVQGVKEFLTYDAPAGTMVGDEVTVPPFPYEPAGALPRQGNVVTLGSDYTGTVVPILSAGPGGPPGEP
jgi:hypothetical protein